MEKVEQKEQDKKYLAVEESILQRLIQVVSNLPYNSVCILMKDIENSEFKKL
jgi:hypothetical protein